MMRNKIVGLSFILLAVSGCTGPVIMGSDAAAMYITKPSDPSPADLESQIQPHETWCYSTLGDPVCYAHPQDVAADRLINVDPQNRYPLTPHAYHDAVVESQ